MIMTRCRFRARPGVCTYHCKRQKSADALWAHFWCAMKMQYKTGGFDDGIGTLRN